VWVFAGGPAPVRTAVLRSGIGGRSIEVADLDRDTHVDVVLVTKDDARVDVFYGDGTGRFPRSATLNVEGVAEAFVADLDGDGHAELLVGGRGLHLVTSGAAGALEAQPIDAPAGLSDLAVADIDSDGERDVIGLSAGVLVALLQAEPTTFREARLATFERVTSRTSEETDAAGTPATALRTTRQSLAAHRVAIADLDGDGTLDAAVLVRSGGATAAWELVLLPDIRRARNVELRGEPARLRDAPLVLHVSLG
jgi:hypothetical protein